jgi:hypothetical protein
MKILAHLRGTAYFFVYYFYEMKFIKLNLNVKTGLVMNIGIWQIFYMLFSLHDFLLLIGLAFF